MRQPTTLLSVEKTSKVQSLSTELLVDHAVAGREEAFEELMGRHHHLIFRTANRILKNIEDTEDAVQDVFIKAFRHLGSFRGDSKFSTWLVRITVNVAIMQLRKRKVRPVISIEDLVNGDGSSRDFFVSMQPTAETICSDKERRLQLHSAMLRLPVSLREAITLRLEHDHKIDMLAALMGISQAAAKSRLMRARNLLVQQLLPSGCSAAGRSRRSERTNSQL